ncbi:hypothetical protein PtB15_13B2 [Puccinia triticina]|nr:hypothetical protein PtB15_13B2 [Puccinia triticina]
MSASPGVTWAQVTVMPDRKATFNVLKAIILDFNSQQKINKNTIPTIPAITNLHLNPATIIGRLGDHLLGAKMMRGRRPTGSNRLDLNTLTPSSDKQPPGHDPWLMTSNDAGWLVLTGNKCTQWCFIIRGQELKHMPVYNSAPLRRSASEKVPRRRQVLLQRICENSSPQMSLSNSHSTKKNCLPSLSLNQLGIGDHRLTSAEAATITADYDLVRLEKAEKDVEGYE